MNCVECKKEIKFTYMDFMNEQMKSRQMCFNCNFWTDYMGRTDTIRIDGMHYVIAPDTTSGMKGYGGHEFKIKRFDTEGVIVTHNLWHQGDIPAHFRDRLPDNAEFVE